MRSPSEFSLNHDPLSLPDFEAQACQLREQQHLGFLLKKRKHTTTKLLTSVSLLGKKNLRLTSISVELTVISLYLSSKKVASKKMIFPTPFCTLVQWRSWTKAGCCRKMVLQCLAQTGNRLHTGLRKMLYTHTMNKLLATLNATLGCLQANQQPKTAPAHAAAPVSPAMSLGNFPHHLHHHLLPSALPRALTSVSSSTSKEAEATGFAGPCADSAFPEASRSSYRAPLPGAENPPPNDFDNFPRFPHLSTKKIRKNGL